jgi:hypothetical protein
VVTELRARRAWPSLTVVIAYVSPTSCRCFTLTESRSSKSWLLAAASPSAVTRQLHPPSSGYLLTPAIFSDQHRVWTVARARVVRVRLSRSGMSALVRTGPSAGPPSFRTISITSVPRSTFIIVKRKAVYFCGVGHECTCTIVIPRVGWQFERSANLLWGSAGLRCRRVGPETSGTAMIVKVHKLCKLYARVVTTTWPKRRPGGDASERSSLRLMCTACEQRGAAPRPGRRLLRTRRWRCV